MENSQSLQSEDSEGDGDEVTKDCYKTLVEKKIRVQKKISDPIETLQDYKDRISSLLRKYLIKENIKIKFFFSLNVLLLRDSRNNEEPEQVETDLESGTFTIIQENQIDNCYNRGVENVLLDFDKFIENGSGWRFAKCLNITLRIAKYDPIPGCSYIKTPRKLRVKKAVVNIKNKDNKCFEYSCLAELHKKDVTNHRDRPSMYKKWLGKTLDMGELSEPMILDDIESFEKRNQIGINVYRIDEKGEEKISWEYHTSLPNKKIINLLKIDGTSKSHFTLITNLNRLLNSQRTNHKKDYCELCLTGFDRRYDSKKKLEEHKKLCSNNMTQTVNIPSGEKSWVEYKNFQLECKYPIICYCDFETIAENFQDDSNLSNTRREKVHKICGYSLYIYSEESKIPSTNRCFTYCGKDAGAKFLETLNSEILRIKEYLIRYEFKDPILSEKEEIDFLNSTICHLCKKQFEDEDIKVRNHDHYNSKYLGSAHQHCNLSYRRSKTFPCFFHNFSGYDSHLIIQEISNLNDTKHYIKPVAKNLERFISFKYKNIEFKDSLRFIPYSLDKICADLKNKPGFNKNKFPATYKHFKERYSHLPEEAFEMLTRKLPFPYDYLTFERLTDEVVPEKQCFDNILKGESITEDDYSFIKNLWKVFEIKNVRELLMLYNEVDTLLLCDAFTEYRKFCYDLYQLEAARFVTSPSLAWSAALKMSKTRLEIPQDINMHNMIDNGLRGGISLTRHPFTRANHTQLEEFYDSTKPKVFLSYTDVNNLYGAVMMQALPTDGFCFVKDITGKDDAKIEFEDEVLDYTTDEWEQKIISVDDNGQIGFIFQVSLSYPMSLHDLHNELPFCAENIKINSDMLSDYQLELAEEFGQKTNNKISKLCLTLSDKEDYVCHFRVLKQALQHGLKLKQKPQKILQFNQSPFLKKYITTHQNIRRETDSPLTKAFCKNQNNVVFGKSCENVKDYKDIYLTTNKDRAQKYVNSPRLKTWKIYPPYLSAFQLEKQHIELNKPRVVGMSILEISKTFLFSYFYDYILPKFPDTKVILTDTDSFCLAIPTEQNFYEVTKNDKHVFDFSNLPDGHPCFDDSQKMISGLMKDEMGGELLLEVVALRPKMYSMLTLSNSKNIKRAKGVLKPIVEKKIAHDDYKHSLFQKEILHHSGLKISQKEHQLYTTMIKKRSLCPYNDKMFISKGSNGEFYCYSFGHYKLQNQATNYQTAMEVDD